MTHLLSVAGTLEAYRPLLAAAAEARMRLGWLELAAPVVDPSLEAALGAGAFRAGRVGAGRSLAAKRLVGEAVLRDVVREQFKGCVAVLVVAAADLPRLVADGSDWSLVAVSGERRRLDTPALLALLRRPAIDPR